MKRPLCFCCLIFLILLRFLTGIAGVPDNPYDGHQEERCVLGTVGKKEIRNGKTVVCLEDVDIGGQRSEIGLLCVLEEGEIPPVGARIEVRGKIRSYSSATNPGEFDLRFYYLCKGYGARMAVEGWRDVGDGRYDMWQESLWRFRCRLGKIYDELLPPEDAGVMKAVVLGDKGELAGDLKELYRINGIVHILAISGLHISILGMGLYRFLRRLSLPVFTSAFVAVFFMVNYAIFTGAGTSTVRAVAMFSILSYAEVERRSYDLPTALLLSAAVTAVFNPYELFMSAFWLSYTAVFGIAVFFPALTEGVRFHAKWAKKMVPALGGSIATSLFTLPLILTYYYEAPLYASLLNLIVIPLMSVLMVFGLIAFALGGFFPVAGIFAAYPCHLILSMYTMLCERIMSLPAHSVIVGCPGTFRLLVSYVLLIAVLLTSGRILGRIRCSDHPAAAAIRKCFRIRKQKTEAGAAGKAADLRRLLALRGALCFLALLILLVRIRTGLTLTMLDVGQGDGLCFETADTVLMIDGGSTSRAELAKYQLVPFLKYSGVGRVDYWYITHPDADHDSGLIEFLADDTQTIRIGAIVLPDAYGAEEDFADLIALADARGVPVLWNSAGKSLMTSGLTVECLHPRSGFRCDDVNTYSQVLAVTGYGFSGLFTGDATTESEEELLKNLRLGAADTAYDPDREIPFRMRYSDGFYCLKVGHHGSSSSSSQEFLDFVQPHIALISCGYRNRYGHPHDKVMERLSELGCETFRTDYDGAVILTARGSRIRITRFAPR